MAGTGKKTTMAGTGKKTTQNVFADDDEGQQPNAAFNQAVEAAKSAATPQTDQTHIETVNSHVSPPSTPAAVILPALPAVMQGASNPEKQKASKPDRDHPDYYSKVTYRVLNEAADAVEDMKLLLKRKYGFKRINLEEIVEAAILGIKQDLDEQKEQSILVQRLKEQRLPESQ
jgi:glycerol-3-phosphate dehydrogenase